MRIGSYSRSHRRGTFAALCAFLATAGMGITCTPQQASAEGPQFDAEYLAREKQFGAQWASEDKQVRERLAYPRFGRVRLSFVKTPSARRSLTSGPFLARLPANA